MTAQYIFPPSSIDASSAYIALLVLGEINYMADRHWIAALARLRVGRAGHYFWRLAEVFWRDPSAVGPIWTLLCVSLGRWRVASHLKGATSKKGENCCLEILVCQWWFWVLSSSYSPSIASYYYYFIVKDRCLFWFMIFFIWGFIFSLFRCLRFIFIYFLRGEGFYFKNHTLDSS